MFEHLLLNVLQYALFIQKLLWLPSNIILIKSGVIVAFLTAGVKKNHVQTDC